MTAILDNLLKGGIWSDSDQHRRPSDPTKAVYEILVYVRATAAAASSCKTQAPPAYNAPQHI